DYPGGYGGGGMLYGAEPAPSPVATRSAPANLSAAAEPAPGKSLSPEPSLRSAAAHSDDNAKKDKPAAAEPAGGQKLAASLRDLVRQGAVSQTCGLDGSQGKVTVKIWLTNLSARALKKLKAAGLEITIQHQTSKIVIGRIDMKKLEELTKLDFVKLIEPS